MYAALDHFMESRAIYKFLLILLLSRLIYKQKDRYHLFLGNVDWFTQKASGRVRVLAL